MASIIYIFALFSSSHFNPIIYAHNFQNAYDWFFTVETKKLNEIKNFFKTKKILNNGKEQIYNSCNLNLDLSCCSFVTQEFCGDK